MPRQGLVTLPPARIDVAISKSCVRAATPVRERSLRVMTWLADEKILLTIVGLFWLNARLRPHGYDVRCEANRMLLGVALAGIVPHATFVVRRLERRYGKEFVRTEYERLAQQH